MSGELTEISRLITEAGEKARRETQIIPEPQYTKPAKWPIECIVGPGLEGAIACESKVGYVNGAKGWLIYRGYDIFDLCANSTFEEVSYLLLHGNLPSEQQLGAYKKKLIKYREINSTARLFMNFPIEQMNAMAALCLGTRLLRHDTTYMDRSLNKPEGTTFINADEDSIPMETRPKGEEHAIYEIKGGERSGKSADINETLLSLVGFEPCYCLISGVASLTAVAARLRQNKFPLEPDSELSHAANLIYTITGCKPSALEERIMDISLILHADHGMNASTFASLVVASTLSDIYFAVGAGIAALNGSLHGGANEQVILMLKEIGSPENVKSWYGKARAGRQKIMGFGHRVYKAYDPRARVLGPLAEYIVKIKGDRELTNLFNTAQALEKEVVSTLGVEKGIFPNVDFYSGIVYAAIGIPVELFTPLFAVSRVAGWTARVMEYLENNRIFRPRAMYVGSFDRKYVSLNERGK